MILVILSLFPIDSIAQTPGGNTTMESAYTFRFKNNNQLQVKRFNTLMNKRYGFYHWYKLKIPVMGKLTITVTGDMDSNVQFTRVIRAWLINPLTTPAGDIALNAYHPQRRFRRIFNRKTPGIYYLKLEFRNRTSPITADIRYGIEISYSPIPIQGRLSCSGKGLSRGNPCHLGDFPSSGRSAGLRRVVKREGHLTAWDERENWFSFGLKSRADVEIMIKVLGDFYHKYYRCTLFHTTSGTEYRLVFMHKNNAYGIRRRKMPPGNYLIHHKLGWQSNTINNAYRLQLKIN